MNSSPQPLVLRMAAAAFGFLPLMLLVLWAYEPARPFEYPTVRELLSSPYQEPGVALDAGAYRIRAALVLMTAVLCAFFGALRVSTARLACLAGLLASLLLTSPLLVNALLGAVDFLPAAAVFLSILAAGGLLLFGVRNMPATQLVLALLLLLLGMQLTLRTAAAVAIRSEPVLYVLDAAAQRPDDPHAQLALGLHLLSIDGPCQAIPLLRRAGARLAEGFAESGEKALFDAANSLVELSVTSDTSSEVCATELQESDH